MIHTYGLERIGIFYPANVYRNMSPAWLTEQALIRGEGMLSDTGALVVQTGKYTGRSPKDKFIVDTPAIHEYIAWNNVNRPISREKFTSSKIFTRCTARRSTKYSGTASASRCTTVSRKS